MEETFSSAHILKAYFLALNINRCGLPESRFSNKKGFFNIIGRFNQHFFLRKLRDRFYDLLMHTPTQIDNPDRKIYTTNNSVVDSS